MYCPQCGQQQASGEMRFCSRCGFPLSVIAQVVAQGGLPVLDAPLSRERKLSARQKGLRKGAMLMLSTMLVVPLTVFTVVFLKWDALIPLVPISAVVCVIGGLLRIFYALMFEDTVPVAMQGTMTTHDAAAVAPAELNPASHLAGTALPPAQGRPVMDWHRRHETAEIVQPPSVTENTTRLLDRNDEGRVMNDE